MRNDRTSSLVACAVLLVTCAVTPSAADVAFLSASKDNALFENDPDASSGAGLLFSGQTGPNSNNTLRRTVIAFDVAGAIPAGSLVQQVGLEMEVGQAGPGASASDIYTIHRLLADWGEAGSFAGVGLGAPAEVGDATWTRRFWDTVSWTTPGGDFAPAFTAATAAPLFGVAVWDSLTPGNEPMVADVQQWLADPASNFGWILIGNETEPMSVRSFESKDTSMGSTPRLFIMFDPAPPPPAVPDGATGPPLLVQRLTDDGSMLELSWDAATCVGDDDHHIIYAGGSDFPAMLGEIYPLQGGVCDVGALPPYLWDAVPDPLLIDPTSRLLWFILLANNGGNLEGSWGLDSTALERNGAGTNGSSEQCGITNKNITNSCGN